MKLLYKKDSQLNWLKYPISYARHLSTHLSPTEKLTNVSPLKYHLSMVKQTAFVGKQQPTC